MRLYYNKLGYGLSRELWLIQIGIFLNTFGWGAVLPFEVIYLHDGRGLSLGTAGLVVGTLTGAAVVSAPPAGRLIDRVGARTTAVAAGSALAAGYAGLAFAHSAGAAFAAAVIGGVGNGALSPAQTTLLVTLTRREYRHRATAVSRVCTNAGFGLGGAAGGLCAAHGLNGYVLLFLLNAATYLVYVIVLVACVPHEDAPEPLPGGYRHVVRDRAFVQLALANVAVIGVGWGVLPWVVPPFATRELGVGPTGIGMLMLANAATVVVVQVPVARFSEGRRRVVMMATGSIVFAAACLLILSVRALDGFMLAALVVGSIAIGIGECFHSAALGPLVADLAPPGLRGRYQAGIGLSWWLGLALAPTVGTQLLTVSASLTFVTFAAAAVGAAIMLLALEARLPHEARSTPSPALISIRRPRVTVRD
jgi:MFS family permease